MVRALLSSATAIAIMIALAAATQFVSKPGKKDLSAARPQEFIVATGCQIENCGLRLPMRLEILNAPTDWIGRNHLGSLRSICLRWSTFREKCLQ